MNDNRTVKVACCVFLGASEWFWFIAGEVYPVCKPVVYIAVIWVCVATLANTGTRCGDRHSSRSRLAPAAPHAPALLAYLYPHLGDSSPGEAGRLHQVGVWRRTAPPNPQKLFLFPSPAVRARGKETISGGLAALCAAKPHLMESSSLTWAGVTKMWVKVRLAQREHLIPGVPRLHGYNSSTFTRSRARSDDRPKDVVVSLPRLFVGLQHRAVPCGVIV